MKDGIPDVIHDCLAVLNTRVQEEGLLRVPGEKQRAQELESAYEEADQEHPPPLQEEDTHTVGSLMKSFFKQLPEPLFTYELYNDWLQLQRQFQPAGTEAWNREARHLIERLPAQNQRLLQALLVFLQNCQLQSKSNLMTAENLGTVLAPSLCYPPADYPPTQMMSELPLTAQLLTSLVRYYPFDAPSSCSE